MLFKKWFESRIKLKEDKKEIELSVDGTIDFLAPHFGINFNDNEWDNIMPPKIRIGGPGYSYYRKNIYIPRSIEGREECIAHEVGHWLHSLITPNLFENYPERTNHQIIRNSLLESVAIYSEIIYMLRGGNPINNPSLLELAKINYDEVLEFKSEFILNFYKDLMQLYRGMF